MDALSTRQICHKSRIMPTFKVYMQSVYTHAVSLPCREAMTSYVLPWIAVDGCVIDDMA